jgi:hypothetical protein
MHQYKNINQYKNELNTEINIGGHLYKKISQIIRRTRIYPIISATGINSIDNDVPDIFKIENIPEKLNDIEKNELVGCSDDILVLYENMVKFASEDTGEDVTVKDIRKCYDAENKYVDYLLNYKGKYVYLIQKALLFICACAQHKDELISILYLYVIYFADILEKLHPDLQITVEKEDFFSRAHDVIASINIIWTLPNDTYDNIMEPENEYQRDIFTKVKILHEKYDIPNNILNNIILYAKRYVNDKYILGNIIKLTTYLLSRPMKAPLTLAETINPETFNQNKPINNEPVGVLNMPHPLPPPPKVSTNTMSSRPYIGNPILPPLKNKPILSKQVNENDISHREKTINLMDEITLFKREGLNHVENKVSSNSSMQSELVNKVVTQSLPERLAEDFKNNQTNADVSSEEWSVGGGKYDVVDYFCEYLNKQKNIIETTLNDGLQLEKFTEYNKNHTIDEYNYQTVIVIYEKN